MRSRLLLAGLVLLLAAGCGGGGEAATKPDEPAQAEAPRLGAEAQAAIDELDAGARPRDDAGDLERLLQERAVALEAEDILALSATATGGQRARDRRSARRAKRLDIERIRFAVDDLELDGDRAEALVTMSYRVRGMSRPFLTARELTARRRSVGWRVTRDAPRREPLPWEVAPFRSTRARHVVLLTPPGVDPEPLLTGLSAAYRDISRDLPRRDLPDRVLAIGARDAAQTERLGGRLPRGVLARADVIVRLKDDPSLAVERVLAQRMIVVVSRVLPLSEEGRRATLEHEMTHTALDPDTSGRTPPWLVEGVAMYVSDDDRTAEARARAARGGPGITLGRLCAPDAIRRLRGRDQGAAYAVASAAAHAIVARHGTKGLFALYDAFNDADLEGGPGRALTDRALRRTLGMSLSELEAAASG